MGAPFLPTTSPSVEASLSGLNFRLPYITITSTTTGSCLLQSSMSAVMGGEAGASYDVDMHFQGVVEQKAYTGGSSDGLYWQVGGAPDGTLWNTYKIYISSPVQTYYINKGTSSLNLCWPIDYTKTVQVDAGATVSFVVNSIDSSEVQHATSSPASISISGVTDPSQPFPGQWANMTVTKVTKR